jgi:hypothetical protein
MYFEPKFQPSLRVNPKLIPFDLMDNKFFNENVINSPLIFEENEIQNVPLQDLIDSNSLLIPCISDDAFIDKQTLAEPIYGKDFNEIYKSFLIVQDEMKQKEKEELKNQIFSRTLQRKQLLKIYLNKFKIKENMMILRQKNQYENEDRINMDKFLAKVRRYKKQVVQKIQKKKEEMRPIQMYEEEFEEDDDWLENKNLENEEYEEVYEK